MGAAICRRTDRAAKNFNFPDLARELLDRYPPAASYWIDKIEPLSSTMIGDLFARISADLIDLASKEFAIDLLDFNLQQLISIVVDFKTEWAIIHRFNDSTASTSQYPNKRSNHNLYV